MVRGGPHSPAPLPTVSFQEIKDEVSTQPGGVPDLQARTYGYNDGSNFQRPEHYIRYIEPLESELAVQVEYDMDEQDQEWLDAVNAGRKKEQLGKISYEAFEIIMDRLEKEWFDLTKNIPKPDLAMPSEDSKCAICDDSEGENSNAIVFCDGCNLAVHQDCYGVPYIPEGQWLCRKCTVSPENPVSCILCPNEGGAFKQTVHGEWVHLLCAMWIPETRVANEVFMEPITGIDKISKQRWKLKCSICDIREGASIQCAKQTCFVAFHATCARNERLLLPMKSAQGQEPVTLTAYCEKHLPLEQHEARAVALAADEAADEPLHGSSKSARAYAKTYKLGPPLVPALVLERILLYISKINVRKKPEFVAMLCRYWSLKREVRRGAPLLKRLHLEPWTAANPSGKICTEEDKNMKLQQIQMLRDDLGRVKLLTELSRRRESRKLYQTEIIQDILTKALFPHEALLRNAFERIISLDKQDYFKNPVSKIEVPDYFDVIKTPMCWNVIDVKLDRHQYWDFLEFKNDILLVLDNAISYNQAGTFFRAATRIRTSAQPILNSLQSQLIYSSPDSLPNQTDTGTLQLLPRPVGDLEPPLNILDLLLTSDAIKDDIDIILPERTDPLTSLFNFEIGVTKPPPEPELVSAPLRPRPARQSKVQKPKRDRKAQSAARKAKLEAEKKKEMQQALDTSPGFRVPRTRRAQAASAAFEAEAGMHLDDGDVVMQDDDNEESVSAPVSTTSSRQARPKRSLPEVPPIVDAVSDHNSFMLFDQGWIIPEGTRRGGRAAPTVAPAPPQSKARITVPPAKKRRLNPAGSRLSSFGTGMEENQTLERSLPPEEQRPADDDSTVVEKQEQQEHQLHDVSMDSNSHNDSQIFSDVEMTTELETVQPVEEPVAEPETEAIPEETSNESTEAIQEKVPEPPAPTEALSSTSIPISSSPKPVATSGSTHETTPDTPLKAAVGPNSKIVYEADGSVVIEDLDTPALRKAKTALRKAERDRLASIARGEDPPPIIVTASPPSRAAKVVTVAPESASAGPFKRKGRAGRQRKASLAPELVSTPGAGPSRPTSKGKRASTRKEAAVESESELSALPSDNDGQDGEEQPQPPASPVKSPTKGRSRKNIEQGGISAPPLSAPKSKGKTKLVIESDACTIGPDDALEGGTLVWAKADSYPWWPAVIFEDDDEAIPLNVINKRDEFVHKVKRPSTIHAVRFFDKSSTWAWLDCEHLRLLGEDLEFDKLMLDRKSKDQKFKNKAIWQECEKSYKLAAKEMENPGDDTQVQQESATVEGEAEPAVEQVPVEGVPT